MLKLYCTVDCTEAQSIAREERRGYYLGSDDEGDRACLARLSSLASSRARFMRSARALSTYCQPTLAFNRPPHPAHPHPTCALASAFFTRDVPRCTIKVSKARVRCEAGHSPSRRSRSLSHRLPTCLPRSKLGANGRRAVACARVRELVECWELYNVSDDKAGWDREHLSWLAKNESEHVENVSVANFDSHPWTICLYHTAFAAVIVEPMEGDEPKTMILA